MIHKSSRLFLIKNQLQKKIFIKTHKKKSNNKNNSGKSFFRIRLKNKRAKKANKLGLTVAFKTSKKNMSKRIKTMMVNRPLHHLRLLKAL